MDNNYWTMLGTQPSVQEVTKNRGLEDFGVWRNLGFGGIWGLEE